MMKSAEIRQVFLDYFAQLGHEKVPSSSLVPDNDPTLLFANAGMVQFKEMFLGREKRSYQRATSVQRCVRAGGKHNDLEQVGHTARHHTLFEMLGNFSFGDYFKREAITYAWDFLTKELNLPEEKLWVTVYKDDKESEEIWLHEVGVAKERFSWLGEEDNFWSMGDAGPCGPCTEIFYDHGPNVPGGPPGSLDQEGDRYVEIWNLVFMQYDRSVDGEMKPLPMPCVDTGMGLERMAAVIQGVHNNYDIDLFKHIIADVKKVTCAKVEDSDVSLRVIADHIRSCIFLIADGVMPSNEGRGYVLRRIIRRAVRHGKKLGQSEPFLHALVETVIDEMGSAYPVIQNGANNARDVLLQEELQFAKTVEHGLQMFEQVIADLPGHVNIVPGNQVFKLYDTYGFPVDLTADMAREKGLALDMQGFEQAMEEQQERSRTASQFEVDRSSLNISGLQSHFVGYEKEIDLAHVIALFADGNAKDSLSAGDDGIVVLDKTPFYAESGGQVGDQGVLHWENGSFAVKDTKSDKDCILHYGNVHEGILSVRADVHAEINQAFRRSIKKHHSATHLLHAALRRVLGDHVAQKGSLVTFDRLRFDFSHGEAVTLSEVEQIENTVNEQILMNTPVVVDSMSMQEAKNHGAMALFGEKYGDQVRVLTMGDDQFSIELCGGTHVNRTGDIGLFKIISEAGVAAGVRRIEGITGQHAITWLKRKEGLVASVAAKLKVSSENILNKLDQLVESNRQLEKELQQFKAKLASSAGDELTKDVSQINGLNVVAKTIDGVDVKTLRQMLDQLKNKLGSAAVILATVNDDKISLVAGVTSDFKDKIKANELLSAVAQQVGGKGGGRADMAQGGGIDITALPQALASVPAWIKENIS